MVDFKRNDEQVCKIAHSKQYSRTCDKCQFIIASHSPFVLAMKGAQIYDLDSDPVTTKKWTELESILQYRKFFKEHEAEFEEI